MEYENKCDDCGRKYHATFYGSCYKCVICYAKALTYDNYLDKNSSLYDSRIADAKDWISNFTDKEQIYEAMIIITSKIL